MHLGVVDSAGLDHLLTVLEDSVGVGLAHQVLLHQVLRLQQVNTQHPHRTNLSNKNSHLRKKVLWKNGSWACVFFLRHRDIREGASNVARLQYLKRDQIVPLVKKVLVGFS